MVEAATSLRVKLASDVDKEALRDVLARAFDQEAWVNWFVLQDELRESRIRKYFDLYLGMKGALLYTTSEGAGAALWFPPHAWKISLRQQLRLLPDLFRITGIKGLWPRLRALREVAARHPETAHFYLLALGIEPELQGRGIGSILLEPILTRCDEESVPAYLETSEEKNVAFYEHRGFEVRDTIPIEGGPTVRLMWRYPRSRTSAT